MKQMKTQEQFEKEIHEKYNGKISVVGKYIGFYKPVDLFCNKHNIGFTKNVNCVLYQKECCPKCIKENSDNYHKQSIGKFAYNTDEYIKDLEKRGATVKPIEEYKGYKTEILHECVSCGNKLMLSPYKVKTNTKLNLALCQRCGGKRLYVGKNDLWTTDPDIAKLLKNPNDGYKLTRRSDKKADWICPDCGCEILQKTVNNTVMNGLICPLCGNTRSLGHRLVNSVLNELGIEYINEKSFYWSDKKSYDIYIEKMNCIIEVNGIQHYDRSLFYTMDNRTLEDEIRNDEYKKELAETNGIENYIYIDARESDIKFIVDSIKNNEYFNNIFDTSNVNWSNVVENALTSDTIKIRDLYNSGTAVSEIQKIVHMSSTVVERKLHSLTEYGLCDYKGIMDRYKPVVCLNTGECFDNLQEAGKAYNIDANGISFCCRGLRNRRTAGRLSDGTKLTWLFKEDYDLKTEEEIQEIINQSVKKRVGSKRVICLNTEEVFDSIKSAKTKYPDAKSISDCCRHISKSSGTLPTTKEKMKWLYYDEYINTSKEKIQQILNDTDYDDKRVICLNTLEIFENATIASEWCGVQRSGICSCIAGNYITNGKHPQTGEQLRWMKYKDYIKEFGEVS